MQVTRLKLIDASPPSLVLLHSSRQPLGTRSHSAHHMAVRNTPKQRQRQESSTPEPEADEGGRGEQLELANPKRTMQHLFLQSLMARKIMTFTLATTVYNECIKLCAGERRCCGGNATTRKRRKTRLKEQTADAPSAFCAAHLQWTPMSSSSTTWPGCKSRSDY